MSKLIIAAIALTSFYANAAVRYLSRADVQMTCLNAAHALSYRGDIRHDYVLACDMQLRKEAGVKYNSHMLPKAPESEWLGEPTFGKNGRQTGFAPK